VRKEEEKKRKKMMEGKQGGKRKRGGEGIRGRGLRSVGPEEGKTSYQQR